MSRRIKIIVSVLVGLGISVGCLAFVLRGVQWDELVRAWNHMHWWWAVGATLLYLFGQWLRGVRCSWILKPYCQISSWDASQVVLIGYAANNVLPARLGELVRSYVLAKREDLDYGISFSTLLVERILDGLAIVGILWFVASFGPRHIWIERIGWIAGGIFAGAFTVLLLARFSSKFYQNLMGFFLQFLPKSIAEKIENFGMRLLEGTQCLRWDHRLPGIIGMSLLIWIVEGGMFLLMLNAFGWQFSFFAAYLAMSITNLGVLVPSSPGHIGTFHAFCAKVLLVTGIVTTSSQAFGYAAVLHILQLVPVTILGLLALYSYGFNLRTLWKIQDDSPKPSCKSPAPSPVSP